MNGDSSIPADDPLLLAGGSSSQTQPTNFPSSSTSAPTSGNFPAAQPSNDNPMNARAWSTQDLVVVVGLVITGVGGFFAAQWATKEAISSLEIRVSTLTERVSALTDRLTAVQKSVEVIPEMRTGIAVLETRIEHVQNGSSKSTTSK